MLLLTALLLFSNLLAAHPFPVNRPTSSGCTYTAYGHTATGYETSDGACRYTIKYGIAERWAESVAPHQNYASEPPSCPQNSGTYTVGSSQSEDCLYATVYVPKSTAPSAGWPVFVWIHGGSFVQGSTSAPGLDGSLLAKNGNMIVIMLQYRLGVFGLLPPTLASTSSDPSLGLKDVILGLKGVNQYIDYVGGNRGQITVGGQSSGASMIRALWGAPAASGLFRAAILQSDPMSFGFASSDITTQIQSTFYAMSPMSSCTTLDCLKNISASALVTAQDTLISTVPYTITGVPFSEPLRPTYNTTALPSDPSSTLTNSPSSLTFTPASLPILLTTVKNEGGTAISSIFSTHVPLSNDTYYSTASALIGTSRATSLVSSEYYSLPAINSTSSTAPYGPSGDTFRETFERAVTDGIWKCANVDVANKWASAGGKVWVGEWREGVTYPDNESGYCTGDGIVCHEDDIYPTFGTASDPSSNTSTLESTIFSHWVAFITTLNPNPSSAAKKRSFSFTWSSWWDWSWNGQKAGGSSDFALSPGSSSSHSSSSRSSLHSSSSHAYSSSSSPSPTSTSPSSSATSTATSKWSQYTSESDVFALGGDEQLSGACPAGFWGDSVPFDWQLYD
ncbi:hypothetical protein L198_05309 [Cryptococcus wingfieldii CBS 7118]|uniref:Carboxylesterase type B domain-containing protein n=1 Tax=Cryptococcus wingfieldii CBS 7118 TaxID=1295528 RepID=A0A1E3IXW9_9TREE|nr:hypothetical protein L198_05309 [Cryptococcus wingfieldii CBS 7118]ODN93444.1 hypothetical protein L198_05309 [Cryptococcus wingfieldii CBS 7118]